MPVPRRPFDMAELFTYCNGLPYRAADRIDGRFMLVQLIVGAITGMRSPLVEGLCGKLREAERLIKTADKNAAVPYINDVCKGGQPLFDAERGRVA